MKGSVDMKGTIMGSTNGFIFFIKMHALHCRVRGLNSCAGVKEKSQKLANIYKLKPVFISSSSFKRDISKRRLVLTINYIGGKKD